MLDAQTQPGPTLIEIPAHLKLQAPPTPDAPSLIEGMPDRPKGTDLDQTIGSLALQTLPAERFHDETDFMIERTVKEGAARIDAKIEAGEKPEDANTSELLHTLPITRGVSIDGQRFYLSDVVTDGRLTTCVGYVELPDGQVAPRLFYKSNSQGEWRVSPRTERVEQENGTVKRYFSKGETMDYGYARETQLHDDLSLMLKRGEERSGQWSREGIDWVMDHFGKDKLGSTFTYEDEAFETRLSPVAAEVFAFMPGRGFATQDGTPPAREILKQAKIPGDKTPDFGQHPTSVSYSEHPILGRVTTERFVSRNGALIWSVSHDKVGRVWLAGVAGAYETKPNTYGTNDEVVSVGVLDNKPIEYGSQVQGLEPGVDFAETARKNYVDITPLLDNLPIVQEYRAGRQVQRV